MASNANADVDKLISFGQMALEQGWYDKAREYFQQVLALDASNREALKGLARVNEILSRSRPMPVEPTRAEPVKPRPKVATTNKVTHGLAAILALAVVVTLVWIVYSMFIEPRREVAVAPTATALSTETPKPTPIPPTPTQKEPTPTPVVLAETIFGEAVQKQIYSDYVEALSSNVGDKAYETVAQQWETTVDIVKAIAVEGFKKNWGTPTPLLTHTPQPTAALPREMTMPSEEAYLSQFYEIIGIYANSSHELALLEQEIFSGFQAGGITGWNSRWGDVNETIRQTGERVQGLEVPARYERVHQELEQVSQHVQSASNALLTGAREQARYLDTWDRDSDEYSHRDIEQARQKLALASESMMRAKLEQQLALPTRQMSYAEIDYLQAVGEAPVCFTNAEGVIKSLMREMARDPYIRGDRSWQKDMAAAKALFLECLDRLRQLNPPPRLTDIHDDLVRCGNLYFSAAYDDYRIAIEELLPEAIEYGDEAMKQGADCFEQAFDEIDEILGL